MSSQSRDELSWGVLKWSWARARQQRSQWIVGGVLFTVLSSVAAVLVPSDWGSQLVRVLVGVGLGVVGTVVLSLLTSLLVAPYAQRKILRQKVELLESALHTHNPQPKLKLGTCEWIKKKSPRITFGDSPFEHTFLVEVINEGDLDADDVRATLRSTEPALIGLQLPVDLPWIGEGAGRKKTDVLPGGHKMAILSRVTEGKFPYFSDGPVDLYKVSECKCSCDIEIWYGGIVRATCSVTIVSPVSRDP